MLNTKSLLQEQAYNTIKQMILSNELKPDTLYSETKMAAQIGISRTPMREALQCLAQDGYITVIPSKGFMIRQLSEKDVHDSIQIRCALEGFCVQLIASETETVKGAALLKKLEKLLDKQEKSLAAKDFPKSFSDYDHEFHLALIHYAENAEISHMFQRILYLIHLTTTTVLTVPGRAQATLEEHRIIYECLKNGDGDGAYRFMIAHLMLPLNMKMFH